MLIVCAGMYRACSTWQYDVVADLIERHRQGSRLGYLSGDQVRSLDRHTCATGTSDGTRPWAVLKSHEGHAEFTRRLRRGQARAIYAYRDVRDVAYSLIHKRAISFPTLLRRGLLHQILANHRYWSSRPGVLVQRYEEIVARPDAAVRELAEFIGLDPTRREVESIVNAHSLAANRERTRALGDRLKARGLDLDDPANAQHFDPHTLLHWNHVRDGRSGSWRDQAGPTERQVMARLLGDWLIDHGYEPDVSWANRRNSEEGSAPSTSALRLDQARGSIACGLRGLSSRFPRLARTARIALRRPEPEMTEARPVVPGPERRVDPSETPIRGPHHPVPATSRESVWSKSA
jgi:hypothetical protein